LVLPDMLGFSTDFKPKFVRTYLDGANLIKNAVNQFAADVHTGAFPGAEETYAPSKEQLNKK
jgi:3-methyl-2-oxobutanoate hydroxymethyltransferase